MTKLTTPSILKEALKQIRKDKGLTQKQMGELLDMTQTSYADLENDRYKSINLGLYLERLAKIGYELYFEVREVEEE